ncbi:MFS transporter, partial [Caballeronia sp. INML3]
RSVFWVGGLVPLLLAVWMVIALPESLQFLVLKGREARARDWLAKFDPSLAIDASTRLVVREKASSGAPVAELFRAGRGPVTLILWAIS